MKKLQCIMIAAAMIQLFSCSSTDSVATNLPTDNLNENLDSNAVFPHHSPLGKGVGACPGRVVWTWDRKSVDWDGEGYWWELDNFNEASIQRLTDDGIARLANASDAKAGWQILFTYNNQTRGRSGGYQQGQKIAIKANINGAAEYDDDPHGCSHDSYTNPVVLKCLLVSLVKEAGVRRTLPFMTLPAFSPTTCRSSAKRVSQGECGLSTEPTACRTRMPRLSGRTTKAAWRITCPPA